MAKLHILKTTRAQAAALICRIHDFCAHRRGTAALVPIFREAEACVYETREGMAADLGASPATFKRWMRDGSFPDGAPMKRILMQLRRRLAAVASDEWRVSGERLNLQRGTIDRPVLVYPPAVEIWWTTARA